MATVIVHAATGLNPWRTVWLAPRAAMRRILENDPHYFVLALAATGGVLWTLEKASSASLPGFVPLLVVLALVVLGGPLLGLLKLYLGGWLVACIGRSFGGHAAARHTRAALAWGSVPALATRLVSLGLMLALGESLFVNAEFDHSRRMIEWLICLPSPTAPAPETAPSLLAAILLPWALLPALAGFLWTVVATVKCTAEAHGFSAWRALLTLIVTWLTVGLVVVVPYLSMVSIAVVADWMS